MFIKRQIVIEYLKSKKGKHFNLDDVSFSIIPLFESFYLDCQYHKGSEFKENAETITIHISSQKFNLFIERLYSSFKTKKIANSYIDSRYFPDEEFLIAQTSFTSYKEKMPFDDFEESLIEQGYLRFLEKDLIDIIEMINSPVSLFDTLFRCRYKNIWSIEPVFSYVFLALESGWSAEKIIKEMYLPYMSYFVDFPSWSWRVKKKIDLDFVKSCQIAYNEIKEIEAKISSSPNYPTWDNR